MSIVKVEFIKNNEVIDSLNDEQVYNVNIQENILDKYKNETIKTYTVIFNEGVGIIDFDSLHKELINNTSIQEITLDKYENEVVKTFTVFFNEGVGIKDLDSLEGFDSLESLADSVDKVVIEFN